MTPTTTSPETKRSLEPGRRMIIFGGNDSTLAQFRRAGERYDFVNVGDAKRMKELPAKNFDYAVVNGKVPDFLPNIIAMADRAGAKEIIVVEDGGHITKMMMSYPKGLKGVVTFDITGVTQVIPLGIPAVKRPDVETIGHPPAAPAPEPPAIAKELRAAIEHLQFSMTRVTELATEVAVRNEELQAKIDEQTEQLKDLPVIQAKLERLLKGAKAAQELYRDVLTGENDGNHK